MLILALGILAMSLVWYFAMRTEPVNPLVRRVAIGFAIACVCAALAVRAGPALGLLLVSLMLVAVWLRLRGRGDDGPGDDGREPPTEPDPDPGPRPGARVRPEISDQEAFDQAAFDRARAEWEQDLPKPQSTDSRGESPPPITAQRRSAAYEGVHPAGTPPIDPGPRRQQGFIHDHR